MPITPRYKIGATEAGDAGLDLTWVTNLARVHGAIVISKSITPEFHDAVLKYRNKLVIQRCRTPCARCEAIFQVGCCTS